MKKPKSAGVPGSAGVPAGSPLGAANEDVGAPGPPGTPDPKEWYSRGYLPHRNTRHRLQSITYRLADSLPQQKLEALKEELASLPEDKREAQQRRRIEEWLDAGMGCCALRHSEVARYVEDSFKHFHSVRYLLLAWCVMPNHVHVLIKPQADLATIVQGWKSFTSRWILAQNDRLGLGIPERRRLWMREYWDRYIRDSEHCRNVIDYIHRNPVKARLCAESEGWRWSSAWPENAAWLVDTLEQKAGEDAGAPGDVGPPGAR